MLGGVEEEDSPSLVAVEDSHCLVEEGGRCLVEGSYPLEVLVVQLGAGTGLEVGTLVLLEGGHCLVEVDTHY